MQNEFEKQVRQKMEELDFVPSAPVWQKIEEQIRQKKDRKRLVFWLPLALVLVGVGITWLVLQNDQKSSSVAVGGSTLNDPGKIENRSLEQKNTPHPGNKNLVNVQEEQEQTVNDADEFSSVPSNSVQSKSIITYTNKEDLKSQSNKLIAQEDKKIVGYRLSNGDLKHQQLPIEKQTRNQDNIILKESGETSINGQELSELSKLRKAPVEPLKLFIKPLPAIIVKEDASVIPLGSMPDSNAFVSVPSNKTFGRTPWKFGLASNAGISGAGKGLPTLPLFTQRSDAQFFGSAPTPPPPASLYNRNMAPSQIQNGLSFGAGLVARKQLGKRFAFQTGIQYQFLSTSMKVGSRTISFSAGNSTGGSLQDAYTSASLNDYVNKFHFVSIPALLEYQVLKRKPMSAFAGISLRHLVATNALYFNNTYKVYYTDHDAFNRSQAFAEFGLSYAIAFKDLAVSAGPHIQYSLNELEKQNENRHLVSLGLRALILLQKK